MSELSDLYQEVILHHSKKPRNFGRPDSFNRQAQGHNPLCGDQVTIYLTVEDGVVQEVHFEGSGCAISTASASLMTEELRGRKLEEVEALFQAFHQLVTGKQPAAAAGEPLELGKLEIFSGVSEFPMRVKCASLPWHTVQAAIKQKDEAVTTE